MGKTRVTGIKRLVNATFYSYKGIRAAFRHESAFRQEFILAIILMPVAVWLGRSPVEAILLFGSLIIVLMVELLNSAIEAVVDRTGDEYHKLSGRAKDMGSAAVLFSLLNFFLVWGMIIYLRFS